MAKRISSTSIDEDKPTPSAEGLRNEGPIIKKVRERDAQKQKAGAQKVKASEGSLGRGGDYRIGLVLKEFGYPQYPDPEDVYIAASDGARFLVESIVDAPEYAAPHVFLRGIGSVSRVEIHTTVGPIFLREYVKRPSLPELILELDDALVKLARLRNGKFRAVGKFNDDLIMSRACSTGLNAMIDLYLQIQSLRALERELHAKAKKKLKFEPPII